MNDNKKDLVIDVEALLRVLSAEIFDERLVTEGIERHTQVIREIFDSFEKREVFLFILLYRNIQVCARVLIKHIFGSCDGIGSFFSASNKCQSFFAQLLASQLSYLTVSELKFLQIKIKETIIQITKENKHER